MSFSDSAVAARNFLNTGSVLTSSRWTSSLGGQPPVAFHRSSWTSCVRFSQLRSSLAAFFLAASTWIGIAQAHRSRHAIHLNFARGPMLNCVTLILPATLDCLGSLNFPARVLSAIVLADAPVL